MPRPVWNGAISFGLINIPVKLYNAVKRKTIHFQQLRASDGCKIRLKRVCETDGAEVANTEITKGYEVSPDRYVMIRPEEMEAVYPKTTRRIDIEDFVQLTQIDPMYYERPYYLTPDKGAGKAYSLLLKAMEKSGKVAIAKMVLRNKQYLAVIRPSHSARSGPKLLTLSTMLFADEVVKPEELEGLPEEDIRLNEREMAMAEQLIQSLSAEFEPQKYEDEYRQRILDLIESKAEGQTFAVQPVPEKQQGKVIDLMAALEASLAAIETKSEGKPKRKKRAK
ncbi:Ku protein [Acetonema longum DSM 6540]|uniref:Non-homologous end joining protein Ku n=1 Tax=Acetonema longum DSM 6540 TaxID=1009370 RepID=F7NJ29_9FIRM|nr:Ku protein [Acetonema longum]EGO63952.1 Ku protein [Acetonema longum DSM 6540]